MRNMKIRVKCLAQDSTTSDRSHVSPDLTNFKPTHFTILYFVRQVKEV